MTHEEAIEKGYQHCHLQDPEECSSCGEEVQEGWTHDDTGDFICNDCLKEMDE